MAWVLLLLVSEAAGMQVLIFLAMADLTAVLPKFLLEDLHPQAYKVFVSYGRRHIVTANPRIMVEPFLLDYLNAESVIGTELRLVARYCIGLVASPGVLVSAKKHKAIKEFFGDKKPDIGLGHGLSDYPFMSLYKEAYVVLWDDEVGGFPREQCLKPLVFPDGRLAFRPTPAACVVMFLWLPYGVVLAVLRIMAGSWKL